MPGLIGTLFPDSAIVPSEVVRALRCVRDPDVRWRCLQVYMGLQLDFPVQEDLESPGEWVTGRITASMRQIRQAADADQTRADFDTTWRLLVEAGLIVSNDDTVTLPFLIRKADLMGEAQRHRERLRKGREGKRCQAVK